MSLEDLHDHFRRYHDQRQGIVDMEGDRADRLDVHYLCYPFLYLTVMSCLILMYIVCKM